jgi:hypothetical protein
MRQYKLLLKKAFFFGLAIFLSFSGNVRADELAVTANGSESANEVASTSTITTDISQSNDATITNDVQISSSTGDNSASGNTNGNTTIVSGNSTTDVAITNNANQNTATTGCCSQSSSGDQAAVANNGSSSDNAVSVNNTSTTTIQSNNTANITNNITGLVNTGNNTANHNANGDVTVKTGTISVVERITNAPVNVNNVTLSAGTNVGAPAAFDAEIKKNGALSENTIALNLNNDTHVKTDNFADILNKSLWLFNTGGNEADKNTNGDVTIKTGDISFLSRIVNMVNLNDVTVTCCEEKEEEEKPRENPTGGVTPSTPPTSQPKEESKPSDNKPSGQGKGEVLGTAIQKILPATGNYSFLLFLLGNGTLFLLGVILRLRSGNSPGTQIAL